MEARPSQADCSHLTRREYEVLTLLCDGATSRQIAFAFGLADDTVDQHIFSARQKLEVRNRIELVSYALRNSLLPLGSEHRPGVVELRRDADGGIEDLIFRYMSGDGGRKLPATNQNALNSGAETWAGGEWRENLTPLLDALEAAAGGEERISFEGARNTLLEAGLEYEWSGWVEWINDDHFLVVVTTPLPEAGEISSGGVGITGSR